MEENQKNLEKVHELFSDYKQAGKKPENNNNSGGLKGEDLLAKFFTPRKDKEFFRILPPLDGRKHIETAFFHVVPFTNKNGEVNRFKKIYCPAHNDPHVPKLDANGDIVLDASGNKVLVPQRCPLCEKKNAILAKQDQSIRKVKKEDLTPEQKVIFDKNSKIFADAMVWDAKRFYIVRGIDKGSTGDGVKFWRFKHNFKKQGVQDKLIPVLQDFVDQFGVDFTDVNLGTDLSISVVDNQMPNNPSKSYRDVSSITHRGQSKLHDDPLIVQQWVNDKTTWRDVFKIPNAPELTPTQMLERIARGANPYWDETDKDNKRWVFPDPADAELQKRANTREDNLGSNVSNNSNIEMASDIVNSSYTPTIQNITKEDVGTYNDDAVDVGAELSQEVSTYSLPQQTSELVEETTSTQSYVDDYDDLPF